VTPVGWLERVPTYKERIEQQGITSPSYGLLGYPLLQAADILMYKPRWVPVGADQVPHVELTREVARRFNNAFRPVFPEPDAKLTEIPKVPGTDGRKMSKSYGNAIYLSDPPEVIIRKVKPMVTDPARKRRSDLGNPDVCPVFDLHKIFTPAAEREACATGCRTAGIGCLDCKDVLLRHLCRTNEIDLARLPVRTITDQYLVHLEAIEFRDLEAAGAYLVMAATLIHLKSKLLVPPDPSETEALDEEGEALRLELEERLRAYARVKALGTWLGAREA